MTHKTKLADYFYFLPEELIAQRPLQSRSQSRLLYLPKDTNHLHDQYFYELTELLKPNDLLVLNDTRVLPARLFGQKETSGKVEVLIERIINTQSAYAFIKASKAPKVGSLIWLSEHISLQIVARENELYLIQLQSALSIHDVLQQMGHMPLPPYIQRQDDDADQERYQTIFGHRAGAVAAPTAGLHFDQSLLENLTALGIETTYITLHVWAGTFAPIRVEDIRDHRMHQEYIELNQQTCATINAAICAGRRIIAVGTTVVRALESAAENGLVHPYQGLTSIFIYPGYSFQITSGLITNFHLPSSTLLMLVCAFAGYDRVMHAYHHAVSERYRFFSYGDAMLIV